MLDADLLAMVATYLEPIVVDDAVHIGMHATQNQRVARRSLGEGVPVVRVAKIGTTLEQAFETALAKIRPKAHEIISA